MNLLKTRAIVVAVPEPLNEMVSIWKDRLSTRNAAAVPFFAYLPPASIRARGSKLPGAHLLAPRSAAAR